MVVLSTRPPRSRRVRSCLKREDVSAQAAQSSLRLSASLALCRKRGKQRLSGVCCPDKTMSTRSWSARIWVSYPASSKASVQAPPRMSLRITWPCSSQMARNLRCELARRAAVGQARAKMFRIILLGSESMSAMVVVDWWWSWVSCLPNVKLMTSKLQHDISQMGAYLWLSVVRPVYRMPMPLEDADGLIGQW
jgi:hypothetical protein